MFHYRTFNFHSNSLSVKKTLMFSTMALLEEQVKNLQDYADAFNALHVECIEQVSTGFEPQDSTYPELEKKALFDDLLRGMSRNTYKPCVIGLWDAEKMYNNGLMPRGFYVNIDSLNDIEHFIELEEEVFDEEEGDSQEDKNCKSWQKIRHRNKLINRNEKEVHAPTDHCIYDPELNLESSLFESPNHQEAWEAYSFDLNEMTGNWPKGMLPEDKTDIGLQWFIKNYKPPQSTDDSFKGKRKDEEALSEGRDSEKWKTWCTRGRQKNDFPENDDKSNYPDIDLKSFSPYSENTFYEQGAAGKWFDKLEATVCKEYYQKLLPKYQAEEFRAQLRVLSCVYPEYFCPDQFFRWGAFLRAVRKVKKVFDELKFIEGFMRDEDYKIKLENKFYSNLKEAHDIFNEFSEYKERIFQYQQSTMSNGRPQESFSPLIPIEDELVQKGFKERSLEGIFYIPRSTLEYIRSVLTSDMELVTDEIANKLGIPYGKERPDILHHFLQLRLAHYCMIMFNVARTDVWTIKFYIEFLEKRISDLTSEWEDDIAETKRDQIPAPFENVKGT